MANMLHHNLPRVCLDTNFRLHPPSEYTAHPIIYWQVLSTGLQAEAAGGDDNALLHNMTATLAAVSTVLCVLSAFALVAHNTYAMAQLMVFQAFISPGLILCGFLLFASSAGLATGESNVQSVNTHQSTCWALGVCHRVLFLGIINPDVCGRSVVSRSTLPAAIYAQDQSTSLPRASLEGSSPVGSGRHRIRVLRGSWVWQAWVRRLVYCTYVAHDAVSLLPLCTDCKGLQLAPPPRSIGHNLKFCSSSERIKTRMRCR